jgi:hypothetical protein
MYLNDNNFYKNFSSYPVSSDVFTQVVDGQTVITDDQWDKLGSALIATQVYAQSVMGSGTAIPADNIYNIPASLIQPLNPDEHARNTLALVGYTTEVQLAGQGYTCIVYTPPGYILFPNTIKVSALYFANDVAETVKVPASARLYVSSIYYTKEASRMVNTLTVSVMGPLKTPATGSLSHLVIHGHMIAVGV